MKKTILIVASCFFFIGLILIFSSPLFGQYAGEMALLNLEGAMSELEHERIISMATLACMTGGLVISLVGGFGLILSSFIAFKNSKENKP